MERLKLAELGEKLKTGGAQMSRMVSGKVKEMLQAPSPESKMVDEATSETLEEPNWGMNLRICGMINSDQFNGSEIVKAIKRRINHKNPVVQNLSLDLLEACAMNCEKVFSEIASEKLLEDMLRLVDSQQAHPRTRSRALQLIRAWGQSQDLAYLPVFRQTYMSLKGRSEAHDTAGGNSEPVPYASESNTHEYPVDPPERYPIPEAQLHGLDDHAAFSSNYQHISIENKKKKEHLVVARNSLELLSSILNSDADPKDLKEDLTVSLLDKCKQSRSIIKGIVESTTDDEATLFEALYLNDELQQIVSKYEDLEAAQRSGAPQPQNADTTKHDAEAVQNPNEVPERFESDESEAAQNLDRKLPQKFNTLEVKATEGDGTKVKNAEYSVEQDSK